MTNIPRSQIFEISNQSSKRGNVKNNVVQGSYANVVKGNTVQMQLRQNQESGSV